MLTPQQTARRERKAAHQIRAALPENQGTVRCLRDASDEVSMLPVCSSAEDVGRGSGLNTKLGLSFIPRDSSVYFLASHDGSMIKIGKSRKPRERIADLRMVNPHELIVAVTVPGFTFVETYFHVRFTSLRGHGEWFRYTSDLAQLVESLRGRAWGPEMLADVCPKSLAADMFFDAKDRTEGPPPRRATP